MESSSSYTAEESSRPVKKQATAPDEMKELFYMSEKFEQYDEVRRQTMFRHREMVVLLTSDEVVARDAAILERGLDDAHVFMALQQRKNAMEANNLGDATKIQDSMLQLYKVLMRRKVATMTGQRLPPLNSVFSK
jgi:hypothetical protein